MEFLYYIGEWTFRFVKLSDFAKILWYTYIGTLALEYALWAFIPLMYGFIHSTKFPYWYNFEWIIIKPLLFFLSLYIGTIVAIRSMYIVLISFILFEIMLYYVFVIFKKHYNRSKCITRKELL